MPAPEDAGELTHREDATFSEADRVLLALARERFEFEQATAGALHSKSMLFLTLTGVFGALVSGFVARVTDMNNKPFDLVARYALALSLVALTLAAVILARSALSKSYRMVATPSHWLVFLRDLRQGAATVSASENEVLAILQLDITNAWSHAAEACYSANNARAGDLERVATLISIALITGLVGALLVFIA